ncbi:unnamed protein product [Trichogramma brassicae]|uniref:Uncharacterized protein n=1 Tax=Trichogramma brassicae TaxID=86971 RepID=A0A6H5IK93_9HYME|nr:unnamed protein product [Trichogramma brassicae]
MATISNYITTLNARTGEQRADPHGRPVGGVRSHLSPGLLELAAAASPADDGLLAVLRVVLRRHGPGQGRRSARRHHRGDRATSSTRRSGGPAARPAKIDQKSRRIGFSVGEIRLRSFGLDDDDRRRSSELPQLLMKSVTSLPKSHSSTRTTPTLEPRHVNVFLSALDLSYVAALKFDSRPGLKFLLQKVANLQRPANLYHQACAAWTIKIVALFDLSLAEIGKCGADLKQTKRLVLNDSKSENKFKRLVGYMTQLRTTFDELCGTYVDIALDRDGRYTVADTIAERKFFLLVSQPDDYTELPDEEEAPKNNRIVYNASPENEKPPAAKETPRPFRLSDLASDSSTDSGPQSEPESDDSRPETPSDLNDSQIVFLDRHREAGDKTSAGDENETTKEVKNAENNGTERAEAKKAKRHKKKRGSDDCLLSRRYNLKFIQKDELESYAKKQSLYFRSKSMLELHHHRSVAQRVGGAETTATANVERDEDDDESGASTTGSAGEKLSNEEALEDVAALIKEYEHNRRGFSTNPFLQDERRKTGSLDLDDYCREANKDSETRRRAWAETIGTSLEFALALPDELLAPLLPALVGGIRILTRHAYEPVLKQHLAVFFRRIGHIYGLVDATPATLQICKPNCPTRSGSKSHFRAYHRASSMRKQNCCVSSS